MRQHRSRVMWPDREAGPLKVWVTWKLLRGRWECVGLQLEYADGRPILPMAMRQLRLSEVLEWAAEELSVALASDSTPDAVVRDEAALPSSPPERRGWPTMDVLTIVARVYQDAYQRRENPTEAVQRHLGVSYSAAARRVAACRRKGLLGPAQRGKPGSPLGRKEGEGDGN